MPGLICVKAANGATRQAHLKRAGWGRGMETTWTIAGLVQGMEKRGNAPAIMALRGADAVETWSYRRVSQTARALAGGLIEDGVAPGERIAVLAPNSAPWIIAALALASAGAVAAPIDDLADGDQVRAILADIGARRIFTTRRHLADIDALPDRAGLRVYLLDTGDDQPDGTRPWRSLLPDGRPPLPDVSPSHAASLFYTSGTTGPPKSFVLTHANLAANVEAIAREGLVGPGDRALLPLPLHHAYPYTVGMLTALESGVAVVLPQATTGRDILAALNAARATLIIGVPRLYQALLDGVAMRAAALGAAMRVLFRAALALSVWSREYLRLPLGRALFAPVRRRVGPNLRLLISGGARLDRGLSLKLEALGWRVYAGYGLAETASVFTCNLPGRKRLGSAGKPLAGGKVRINAPDDHGVGEVQLSGPSITGGYRNDAAANAAAFTDDGWFRTGDLGYLDRDGFLFVTGRVKETIVLGGGKKVNPEDVEAVYAAHDTIEEIAVLEDDGRLVALMRPDRRALRRMGTVDAEQAVRVALSEAGKSLPPHARVTGFAIARTPLPRTRLGKFRRFLLPDIYRRAKAGEPREPAPTLSAEDRAFLADPRAEAAWSVIQARYRALRPGLDWDLTLDLGLDSLEWMALSVELEARTGVAVASETLSRAHTVRDLIAAVVEGQEQTGAQRDAAQDRLIAERERWIAPTGAMTTLAARLLHVLDRAVMRVLFRLRVRGLAHLPRSGPFVLIANHASDLDPLALAAALPWRQARRLYWSGDVARLFSSRLRRLFCRVVHIYPIDERAPPTAIETGVAVLERGNALAWFPEGWRSPDGRLQPFRPGIGVLLHQAAERAPMPIQVLPVHIEGSFEALPRTRRRPRLHPIRITIAAPLTPGELAARGHGDTPQARIASALEAAVADMMDGDGEPQSNSTDLRGG